MANRFLSRGKRVDNGEWVYGTGVLEDGTNTWLISNKPGTALAYVISKNIVDPATLGRCTGLEDKNGKLIFEGDICIDSLGWVFKVTWDSENARFIGRHEKPRGDTYICYVGREPKVEIIATIHDTPGELGGEKGEA